METYTIYRATNKVNQKVYIGFTAHWPHRINGHNYDRRYGNTDKAFYNAIKKHGWDAFEWDAIYQSQDFEHTLKVMEPYFINEYRSWVGCDDCNGYNVTRGGEGTTGWKRSPELIESHRQQITGRKQTPEHIEKRRQALTGKPNPYVAGENNPAKRLDVREKLRQAMLGKPKSESHKIAMRGRPQDTETLTCPHCGKIGDYKNMNRWHMDRCKHNLARKTDLEKAITCNVCGHTTKQTPNFYKHHNTNCKFKE
jgi:group I intron endonuclease